MTAPNFYFTIICLLCCNVSTKLCFAVNIETSPNSLVLLQSAFIRNITGDAAQNAENISRNSNASGGLPENVAPSFYGYSIAMDDSGILVGSPKLVDAKNATSQRQPLESSLAHGSIVSCPVTSLVAESSNQTCASVTPPGARPGDSFGLNLVTKPGPKLDACSPTREQICSSGLYNPGYCYHSSNGGRTWTEDIKTKAIDCAGKIDMMIVLDGSSSIGFENFETVKNWTKAISSNFDVFSGSSRIGVVQYSFYNASWSKKYHQLKTEVALGSCASYECFNNKVDKIKLFKSQTFTAHALNKTVNEDFKSSRRFNDTSTSKILILLTDGRSNDKQFLRQSADYVRSFGITTFAIGVGKYAVPAELKTIATGTNTLKRVYQVSEFDKLQEIVNNLKSEIFSASLEGSGDKSTSSYDLQFGETGISSYFSETAGHLYGFLSRSSYHDSIDAQTDEAKESNFLSQIPHNSSFFENPD